MNSIAFFYVSSRSFVGFRRDFLGFPIETDGKSYEIMPTTSKNMRKTDILRTYLTDVRCLTPPKNNSDACVSRTIATWRSGATWVFAVAGHRGGEERARQATCVGIDVPRCASRSGRAARRAVRAERTTSESLSGSQSHLATSETSPTSDFF